MCLESYVAHTSLVYDTLLVLLNTSRSSCFTMQKKVLLTNNPIPHAKILRILCNIKSMSFINTNLNISGTCCTLGYNLSNFLEVFFIAHSIAWAYVCFYHTYALPQMWTFIETCLATSGPFMSGS